MSRLILASASPRRVELLAQIGVSAQVTPAAIDETPRVDESPRAYVERMACEKASKVFENEKDQIVLAADTSVVLGHVILGKPANAQESHQMLRNLSGRQHQVMTGIALISADGLKSQVVTTDVWFRELSDKEIAEYWETGEPKDKAGSYAIQGLGSIFVSRIQGSYSSVVGLPLTETADLLVGAGVVLWQRSVD